MAGHHNIPATDFYGEPTPWPLLDRAHCEELSIRSAQYDWQIKPHRHPDLLQVFFLLTGQGKAEVDAQKYLVAPGDLLIVPAQSVHTFLWQEHSSGYVLFVARPLLKTLEDRLGQLHWLQASGHKLSTAEHQEYISTLLHGVCLETHIQQPHRELQLESLIQALAIWIDRHLQPDQTQQEDSAANWHVENFIELVEHHFNQQHSVDWYANQIGISATHLNNLCKRFRQSKALQLIHRRILTEAQRTLVYTNSTASQIATDLGFIDPAHFSRFFKRHTGITPKQFRLEAQGVES